MNLLLLIPKLRKIREVAVVTLDFRKFTESVFWFHTTAISWKMFGIVTQIYGIVQHRRFWVHSG